MRAGPYLWEQEITGTIWIKRQPNGSRLLYGFANILQLNKMTQSLLLLLISRDRLLGQSQRGLPTSPRLHRPALGFLPGEDSLSPVRPLVWKRVQSEQHRFVMTLDVACLTLNEGHSVSAGVLRDISTGWTTCWQWRVGHIQGRTGHGGYRRVGLVKYWPTAIATNTLYFNS